jgi:tetratricopeptide (TPR) repeat protein
MLKWQCTKSSAFWRRHNGDIEGAIAEMLQAVAMTRPVRRLAKETAVSLNYLADLYLVAGADDRAEEALRESIALARPRYPCLLAANLWILGGMQLRQGKAREALASAEESLRVSRRAKHDYAVRRAEGLIQEVRTQLPPG